MKINSTHPDARAFFGAPAAYFEKDYFIDVRCDLVRELAAPPAGASVLDLGCGDGRISLQFTNAASSLTLVDSSEAMLQRARSRVPLEFASKVQMIASDIAEFKPALQYDVVLCIGVLAHLPSTQRALEVIADLVAVGGVAIVQLTDYGTRLGRLTLRYERMRRALNLGASHWLQPTSVEDLVRDARPLGLRADAVRRYSVCVPGMGRLPNAVLLRWERFVVAHPRLADIGGDAVIRFRK